ncbi:MAG: pyridoxal phosphate-dependent aminotransferase [Gammaproteobacteria bacterium]
MVVTARAAELKAAGKDVIGLGAGEPDFDTPDFIKEAAIQAIHDGKTKYTPVGGTPSLKRAVCEKFKRDNGLVYQPNQVLVTSGGKLGCYNLVQVLIGPGDECIIPAPYWVSYPDMVLLADGKPVIIKTTVEQNFKISPEQLEAAITPRTKMLFLNSPSNPTGVAYSRAELEALGEVLRRHPNIIIGTDDMYEQILWADEPFCNLVMACPDLYDRVVILHGVSKAYAMTGWRIGYNVGPKPIMDEMAKVQSQSASNPCSISQAAAEAALLSDQSCIKPMLKAFKERHDFVCQSFQALNSVSVVPADGAFYSFPNFQQVIDARSDLKNDIELAEFLLTEAGVALVPGSAFGAEGCLRLSFATSMDNLRDALARIKRVLT